MAGGNRPVVIENFRGLNLANDVTSVPANEAVDCLNVDFDHLGVLRPRDGFTPYYAPAAAKYGALHGRGDGILIAHDITNGQLVAHRGGTTVTQVLFGGTTPFTTGIATIGTPAATITYVAAEGSAVRYRFDGTAWTVPVWAPFAGAVHLAVSPLDNRLAVAAVSAVLPFASDGEIWFSDPGAPDTFSANNNILLTPGDGETVSAMVTWRDYLFVFKQTKFFVFYGQSVDATGQPIFNYRSFVGKGAMSARGSAVAARDGVYFLTDDGVYRTTGGEPTLVSGDIDLLFRQPSALAHYSGPLGTGGSTPRLGYFDDHVTMSYRFGSPEATLVYNVRANTWSHWDVAASHFTSISAITNPAIFGSGPPVSIFASGAIAGPVRNLVPGQPYDSSGGVVPINSFWESGFARYGPPNSESTLRETQYVGLGTLTCGWSGDFQAYQAPANVAMGPGYPQSGRGLDRRSIAGEYLSLRVGSTIVGDAWSLARAVPMVRDTRGEGETTT